MAHSTFVLLFAMCTASHALEPSEKDELFKRIASNVRPAINTNLTIINARRLQDHDLYRDCVLQRQNDPLKIFTDTGTQLIVDAIPHLFAWEDWEPSVDQCCEAGKPVRTCGDDLHLKRDRDPLDIVSLVDWAFHNVFLCYFYSDPSVVCFPALDFNLTRYKISREQMRFLQSMPPPLGHHMGTTIAGSVCDDDVMPQAPADADATLIWHSVRATNSPRRPSFHSIRNDFINAYNILNVGYYLVFEPENKCGEQWKGISGATYYETHGQLKPLYCAKHATCAILNFDSLLFASLYFSITVAVARTIFAATAKPNEKLATSTGGGLLANIIALVEDVVILLFGATKKIGASGKRITRLATRKLRRPPKGKRRANNKDL